MKGRPVSRRRHRFLGMGLLVAVLGGLFLVQLYLALREPPTIQIAALVPRMNFSRARVQGILESDARHFSGDTVLYLIDDGTGTLPAFLPASAAEHLPRAGRRVSVGGSLRVSVRGNPSLRASSAADAVLEPVPPVDRFYGPEKLADISVDQKGERLTVYGQVAAIHPRRAGSKAPYKIMLEDPAGRLEVVAWFAPERRIALGDVLKIHGEVEVYQGRAQLRVWEEQRIEHVR